MNKTWVKVAGWDKQKTNKQTVWSCRSRHMKSFLSSITYQPLGSECFKETVIAFWHFLQSHFLWENCGLINQGLHNFCSLMWNLKYCKWWKKLLFNFPFITHRKSTGFTSFIFFLSFCIFRAAHMAYGGSQARGLIGAVAAGLHHSHSGSDSSRVCNLHHSSWQRRILNPLSKVKDWTCNLMVPSWIP